MAGGAVRRRVGLHDAVVDDLLVVVHVVDEHVERPQPLCETTLDTTPLVAGDEPRHDVERPGAVDVLTVRVHGERDAHREDLEVGQSLALAHLGETDALQQCDHFGRDRPGASIGLQQFVHGPRPYRPHSPIPNA